MDTVRDVLTIQCRAMSERNKNFSHTHLHVCSVVSSLAVFRHNTRKLTTPTQLKTLYDSVALTKRYCTLGKLEDDFRVYSDDVTGSGEGGGEMLAEFLGHLEADSGRVLVRGEIKTGATNRPNHVESLEEISNIFAL